MHRFICQVHRRKKVVSVPVGLDQHEGGIEDERDGGDEHQMAAAVDRAQGRRGVVGQHQGGHRDDCSVAKAADTPNKPKDCSPWRRPPLSRQIPTMPFRMIITEAKTVSRASPLAASSPAIINETMRATSMLVTDSASTKVP